jgi:transposase
MTQNNKPTKEVLEKHREIRTREWIARCFGVSISTVRRWVQSYNLQRRRRDMPKPLAMRTDFDSGITIVEKAKRILGVRLCERREGYFLDGRPCNINDVLKAANIVEK